MEVRWSTLAADDLERIFERIAKDNPTAARETVKAIYDGCQALSTFPHRGRPGRMNGRRELVIPPYIVVYQVKENVVEFLASITARRTGLELPLLSLGATGRRVRNQGSLTVRAGV